jgi:DegV family protein with EDD domain
MSIEAHQTTGVAPRPRAGAVAIACESTCCLPPALVARHAIEVIPIPLVFGTETFLDGVDITPAEFYARLARSSAPPKTSPPAPGEYLRTWQRMAARADGPAPGIVMITADGRVTTFGRSTRLAHELAPEALPGVPVAVVDSYSAGMGQGFVALAAARAAEAGLPLADVVRAAERVRDRVRMIVMLDTLEYLARASRIPQVAAWVGGALAIKPVVLFAGGEIRTLARVRTRRRAVAALLDQVARLVPPNTRLHMAVQHTQAPEAALEIAERLAATYDCVELRTTEFTPVMGGYCGPGLLGVVFYPEVDDHGD